MIVGAANYAYREYTNLFLSSLIKNGGIKIKDLRYFVFDFAVAPLKYKLNCYATLAAITNIDRRINVEIIPFERMREITGKFHALFQRLGLRYFMKTNIVDYLKGYLFKFIQAPYLFLDSDIIVKGQIRDLYERCLRKNKIAMARLQSSGLELNFSYYEHYAGKRLAMRQRSSGGLCPGVLFVPGDYTARWFDIFSQNVSSFGTEGHPGLGAWNVIFWSEKGYLIPEKYNGDAVCPRGLRKKAVLRHFVLKSKELMKEEPY